MKKAKTGPAKKQSKTPKSILETYKNSEKSFAGKKLRFKTLNSLKKNIKEEDEEFMETLYNSISLRPEYKLCDLTGMECNYTCPSTNVRYVDSGVYEYTKEIKMVGIVPFMEAREHGRKHDPYRIFFD